MRTLYIEVTGDAAAADSLSPQALAQEVFDKSPREERRRIQQRIARERAGLAQPPADWSKAAPVERYFRRLAALGNDTEDALAQRIGVKRARELRMANNGWENHFETSGCDQGDQDQETEGGPRR